MVEWNPASVEQIINETSQRIEKGVIKVDQAYREFMELDLRFDVDEAKAYLRLRENPANYPAHELKYRTVLEVEDQRRTRNIGEAEYKLMDRNIKALERKLDAFRSIGTSVRQAYAVAGRGE